MKRVGRYIFNGLTVLSLLLCVVTVGMWVFTGVRPASRQSSADVAHASFVDIDRGRVRWARQQLIQPDPPRRLGAVLDVRTWRAVTVRNGSGVLTTVTDPKLRDAPNPLWFHKESGDFTTSVTSPYCKVVVQLSVVCVPLWFPAALLALPAFARWGANPLIRRARWSRSGLCTTCGYDLRGTPERCPECGRVPAVKK